MKKYVAYYRVSTKKQGESGLGLEAQEQQVKAYIKSNGGILLNQFTEIETGTRKRKRIEIHKAISQSKNEGAILIVAKLDRLSRDAEFTFNLMNSEVKFHCLDVPDANETTIGIMAVIAQAEAKRISERIKSAFKAKRKRGEQVGNVSNIGNATMKGVRNSIKARVELAKAKNFVAVDSICELRNDAKYTFEKIAASLNRKGIKTTRGNDFTPKQVQLMYNRYCLEEAA